MDLSSVEFVSDLFRWVDDTYEYIMTVGNVKEYVWWITTRVIRSIFEDYLAPYRDTPTCTSCGSDTHCWSTLVWVLIRCHLSEENMLSKIIKDHPIVVGAYAQWLVSNSERKEALEDKKIGRKI